MLWLQNQNKTKIRKRKKRENRERAYLSHRAKPTWPGPLTSLSSSYLPGGETDAPCTAGMDATSSSDQRTTSHFFLSRLGDSWKARASSPPLVVFQIALVGIYSQDTSPSQSTDVPQRGHRPCLTAAPCHLRAPWMDTSNCAINWTRGARRATLASSDRRGHRPLRRRIKLH